MHKHRNRTYPSSRSNFLCPVTCIIHRGTHVPLMQNQQIFCLKGDSGYSKIQEAVKLIILSNTTCCSQKNIWTFEIPPHKVEQFIDALRIFSITFSHDRISYRRPIKAFHFQLTSGRTFLIGWEILAPPGYLSVISNNNWTKVTARANMLIRKVISIPLHGKETPRFEVFLNVENSNFPDQMKNRANTYLC